jgi:hypothetical protein
MQKGKVLNKAKNPKGHRDYHNAFLHQELMPYKDRPDISWFKN